MTREGLTASEQALVHRLGAVYVRALSLIGMRLRPEMGAEYETLAAATIRGLVIMAPANPGIAERRPHGAPFGGAEWSEPALGLTAIVLAICEPDPGGTMDDARRAAIRAGLGSPAWPVDVP